MVTVALLLVSNIFMTFAWYGHLKHRDVALWKVILTSWGIAFVEYCLSVPANRMGADRYSPFQLKIIQEGLTLVVFTIFAVWYLGVDLRWNHVVSFLFLLGAVGFAFWEF